MNINDPSNNSTNEFVDSITLQFLSSKQQYNKYLSINNKEKYDEIKEYNDKVKRNMHSIIEITKTYCNDPNTQISSELDEIFEAYSKMCIKHIEMKDLESSNSYNYTNDSSEDMMFDKVDNSFHSFWGHKVIKKK